MSAEKEMLSIVILGASGDLAKKLVLPALVDLCREKWLPEGTNLVGYARSAMSDAEFAKRAGVDSSASSCSVRFSYVAGDYSKVQDFENLNRHIEKLAADAKDNRIFYMAIPPNVFLNAAECIHKSCESKTGWTKIVVEKPFGHDLASSQTLMKGLSQQFHENQLYRIDHYLGKELVQNLFVLRFANSIFEPLWNNQRISCVKIVLSENFGTAGRGGYFDNYGIIRDVMQNHMIQVLSLVAMEPPVSEDPDAIRDEKVKVLRAVRPLTSNDVIIGQYEGNEKEPSYRDEEGVPKDSRTPTFATAHIQINNPRWKGVPFILKCGKALDKKKAEVRIQFKPAANRIFPQSSSPNELVIRVQPQEAIYMKMMSKKPGMKMEIVQSELDLTYHERFEARIPSAYEKLLYDVYLGNQSLFVREDELHASWIIFDDLLKELQDTKKEPLFYNFGTRGPPEADEMAERLGHLYDPNYEWAKRAPPQAAAKPSNPPNGPIHSNPTPKAQGTTASSLKDRTQKPVVAVADKGPIRKAVTGAATGAVTGPMTGAAHTGHAPSKPAPSRPAAGALASKHRPAEDPSKLKQKPK